jgi:hypothetical protein
MLANERTARDQENRVSSLGSLGSLIKNEMSGRDRQNDLHQFVARCCEGGSVKAQLVIDHLLSADDEQDIINGMVPAESLRLHILIWISAGKPHYSAKKPD